MNNEKKFALPEAEIIKFPKQDIVTTSGGDSSDDPIKEFLAGGLGIKLPDIKW